MKNAVGLIVFLLVIILVGVYLFLGGEKEVQGPRRISKRVKIEVSPPISNAPDKGRSPDISVIEIEKEDRLMSQESTIEPEAAVIFPKIEKKPFKEEKRLLDDKDKKKEKPKVSKRAIKASKDLGEIKNPWAVNIISVLSKGDAISLLDKLQKDGYNAYITEFNNQNKVWYRVRIGFFSSKEKAQRVGEDLSKKYLRLSSYWIVKPSRNEVLTHKGE